VRGYQNKMLGREIQPGGFEALPQQVGDLYLRYPEMLKLEWRGLNTVFDWLAIQHIKAA
jgi:hypothetical protein